jgi:ubiquinone/menaquinone biosynthesis C-methylase UbiE
LVEESVLFQKDYWERKSLDERRAPTHPVIRQYVTSKIERIRKYVKLEPSTRVLDVGCGNGFFSYYLNPICDTVGVDFSHKMLAKNPIEKKVLMDANQLCFEDMAFDVVISHMLLHHVEDMDKVLQEMRRVSRKYVIILEPNRNNPLMYLYSALVPEERKGMEYSLGYLRKQLEKNKLKVVASFSCGISVPNKMPSFMIPLAKLFDMNQPLGMTNILIAEK